MTTTPLADLKRELAEVLRVPCADPLHWPAQVAWNADLSLTGCPTCNGRGYTQPLMKTCRVTHSAVAEDGWARQANCEEAGCSGLQPRDFGIVEIFSAMARLRWWPYFTTDSFRFYKEGSRAYSCDCDLIDTESINNAVFTAALDALRAQEAGA